MNTNIFQYEIDGKPRFADPLALELALDIACETIDRDSVMKQIAGPGWLRDYEEGKPLPDEVGPKQLAHAVARRAEGLREFYPVICQAFGFATFDPETGQGTTMSDALDAWNAWQGFHEDIKKNTGDNPNSLPSTDQPPPTSTPDPTPTSGHADSGGTGNAPEASAP